MYHYYLFNTVFIILFLFSFSISYYFYFHLSDFSWSWVGFAVLSRIGVIAFIIIYYHLLFFQRDLLCQKCNITPTITFLFSSRHIWKQVLIIFLLLFIGTRFKFNFLIFYDFYLFAVLISCLYFIIDHRVHNAFGIPWQVSSLVKLGTCFIQLSILLVYSLKMVTYKISIGGSRWFVCDKTVFPNQHIWINVWFFCCNKGSRKISDGFRVVRKAPPKVWAAKLFFFAILINY